jgi:hypothetical protein
MPPLQDLRIACLRLEFHIRISARQSTCYLAKMTDRTRPTAHRYSAGKISNVRAIEHGDTGKCDEECALRFGSALGATPLETLP